VEKEGKACEKRKVFNLDLKTAKESLLRPYALPAHSLQGNRRRIVVYTMRCIGSILLTTVARRGLESRVFKRAAADDRDS